jgi:hypothetical protein
MAEKHKTTTPSMRPISLKKFYETGETRSARAELRSVWKIFLDLTTMMQRSMIQSKKRRRKINTGSARKEKAVFEDEEQQLLEYQKQ